MIDPSKTLRSVEKLKAAFRTAAKHAMELAVKQAEDNAKNTTSFYDRSSSGTRSTIKGTVGAGGFTGKLIAKKAALFLQFGTKPHVILPKNGPYLRFQIHGGPWVFAKRVNHPGTKATLFMTHARNVGEQTLKRGFAHYLNQAMRSR
jgi:hypothetical protein